MVNDLRTAARALAASERGDFHPSAEELLSYQAGELERERADRVLRHLAVCAECARTVLDVETFPEIEPVDESRALSTADVAGRWTRFEERLRRESPPATAPLDFLRRVASWLGIPWHSLSFARATAAVLLLATAGLSWTLLSERRPAGEALGPRLNPVLTELAPADASGRRGEAELLRLPPESAGVVLSLALVDPRSYPAYEIEIVAEDGATAWRSSDLHRGREGNFTVWIERDYLPAGSYRIEVRGLDGDRREPLATYRLTLAYE